MMNKFWKMLVDNTILLIVIVGVGIVMFLVLWNSTVKECLKMTTPITNITCFLDDTASVMEQEEINMISI